MDVGDRGRARTLMVVIALVVVAGITVFRLPLTSIFVLGIALLCPLMMFRMHGGGHAHGADHGNPSAPPRGRQDTIPKQTGPAEAEVDR